MEGSSIMSQEEIANEYVDALASEVEEIAGTWKGATGGIYEIKGMARGIARVLGPRLRDLACSYAAALGRADRLESEMASGSWFKEEDIDALQAENERLKQAMAEMLRPLEDWLENYGHYASEDQPLASEAIEELLTQARSIRDAQPEPEADKE
jgi:hypothetical protein